jgi:type IV fimbrial biogenesis protein FimT
MSGDLEHMRTWPRRQRGVTLIELMIGIVLLAILLTLAIPSFSDFRERSVVKGAAEQLSTELANYRFEAVKRNRIVTASIRGTGTDWCIGARQSDASCDCTETPNTCDVGVFPVASSIDERRGTRLVETSGFGTGAAISFDPATGTLVDFAHAGSATLGSPNESSKYQLRFDVNALGRLSVCVPSDARGLPGYSDC